MKKILGIDLETDAEKLMDDSYLLYFQMKLLCIVFSVVSLLIATMNIMSNLWVSVLVAVSFFAISCVNYALIKCFKCVKKLNYAIFDISVLCLFSYFTLTGGNSGFDDVWVMLLPTCSIVFLGRKHGLILSNIMLFIIVFILWFPDIIPIEVYAYTPEFCVLFPIAYIVFLAVGYSMEMLRITIVRSLLHSHKKLLYAIEHDALTGLKNRYWFNEKFCKDYNQKIIPYDCLAMIIDIDDFKRLNDTYGHLEGDAVICCIADSINERLAADNVLCRWGGDEFFVFVPKCSAGEAEQLCEGIQRTVQKNVMMNENLKNAKVTVSIGVVKIPSGDIMDIEKILNKADMRMYKAKTNGKNASCMN